MFTRIPHYNMTETEGLALATFPKGGGVVSASSRRGRAFFFWRMS